jgi:serine/threonine protein kinase
MKGENKKTPSVMPITTASRSVFKPTKGSSTERQTQEFTKLRPLSSGKSVVSLVSSPCYEKPVVMKVFPHIDDHTNKNFHNEVRFASLEHINIIRQYEYKEDSTCGSENDFDNVSSASYIVLEYAPYGDFHNLLREGRVTLDEKLVRTYFHQMITGLEYLHSQGVHHLDIKLSNLLIGNKHQLKIADFDISHKVSDGRNIRSKGTRNFRAPELINQRCFNPRAADIYSAGIVLFSMFTGGFYAHTEDDDFSGVNLASALENDPEYFWECHCRFQKKSKDFFSEEFKELFISMTRADPDMRIRIEGIKRTAWYNKDIYSQDEVTSIMSKLISY